MFFDLTYYLPGMRSARSLKNRLVAIHGGKLYTSNITGHVDQMHVFSENGLNPSVANPNLMFLGSIAKLGQLLSMCIHALESTMCWTRPSVLLFS
jgi:pyruvate dehydrogenase complex dehydrogenase (E1) component